MALYVVDPKSLSIQTRYERSLIVRLVTDAAAPEAIPDPVRHAADGDPSSDICLLQSRAVPEGADGIIVWLEGERLIQGSAAGIRRMVRNRGQRSFSAVHLPCLPDLELIGLMPRAQTVGASEDCLDFGLRVAGAGSYSPQFLAMLQANPEPWARLYLALLEEIRQPGSGIAAMAQLGTGDLHPSLRSLAIRNLVVLLLRHEQRDEAHQLLRDAMREYPGYAELRYIAALLAVYERRAGDAVQFLKKATSISDPRFVGSGGENSYRAHWLMGILAERVGNQAIAHHHFRAGVCSQPAFEPAVAGMLLQRLPELASYRLNLCAMVRREPKYLEPAFYHLLLHRQFEGAERLLRLVPMTEETREQLRSKLDSVASCFAPHRRSEAERPGVILTGPFFAVSSFARVNREIGRALLRAPRFDGSLEPHGFATTRAEQFPDFELLSAGLWGRPQHLDLTVRHHWPHDFRRPPCGKLAVLLPWEYGAVPQRWVEQIEKNVDELWLPSQFVCDVLVRCGVDPRRTYVVPYGVDITCYRPDGSRWRPPGSRGFVFLFVGGAIERKGFDLLMNAYYRTFTAQDDVTLIVKEMGSTAFYRHNSLTAKYRQLNGGRKAPHVHWMSGDLDDEQLAALYRGCDALVHPYRGEGFGLPIAEALACGKRVVTTALGPAREFCVPASTLYVSAREVEVPEEPPPFGPLAGEFTWFEPDAQELAGILRQLYDQRKEADCDPLLTAASMRAWDWSNITGNYLERMGLASGETGPIAASPIINDTEVSFTCQP